MASDTPPGDPWRARCACGWEVTATSGVYSSVVTPRESALKRLAGHLATCHHTRDEGTVEPVPDVEEEVDA